jgi:hypothetical protein
MLSKNKIFIAFSLIASTLLCGCTNRLIDFTVISSKNIEWSRANEYRRANKRVEGVDMKQIIIIIPTGVPNAKQALDRAIESIPGAVALVDGVLTNKFWYIPYIYGQSSYIVEGTPLIDTKVASVSSVSDFYISEINKDGSLKQTRTVGAVEFAEFRSRIIASK